MTLETIFFDLGGVLIDFSHEKMCTNLATLCHVEPAQMKKFLFEGQLADDYERGLINSTELHRQLTSLSGEKIDFEEMLLAASEIFSPKPEMAALLEALKAKGYSLILLSNTCEAHFWFVQKTFAFLELFDNFTLSYEVQARKPEKKIYDAALAKGGTTPEKCFYTDDVPEYVIAARNYGIDSHLFEGHEELITALQKRGCAIG